MKSVVEEILRYVVEKCIAPHLGSLEMGADYSCWREESGLVIVIIMWESSGS